MIPWFLRTPERLGKERKGVEELLRSASWLIGTEWGLDGELYLDSIIRAHDHDYEVRVSFPSLYPDAPIVVRPRNMQQRVSTHQYGGPDGPLCLEWGPDNWHCDVTAVQMLESAYRLFDQENFLGDDRPEIPTHAPSRHRLTVGQKLRGEWCRWYASRALSSYLNEQSEAAAGSFKFSFRKRLETWVALIRHAKPLDGNPWTDESIPSSLPGSEEKDMLTGVWIKTNLDPHSISKAKNLKQLQELLHHFGGEHLLATDGSSPVDGFSQAISGALITDNSGGMHLFVVLSGVDLISCSRVASDTAPIEMRSPDEDLLKVKTIGVVGVGSVGSKLVLSLARMGGLKFLLIDHDVLLPENLRRHALDWQGVAMHKVDSIKAALQLVMPAAQVEVSRLHLSGQESNAALNGLLNQLSECDLLVDATADSRTFNLLASVAKSAKRPLIWMEVFGGGIGGMIARSRPGIDPPPQDMRGAYLQYCLENPAPTLFSPLGRYEAEDDQGEVQIASDSDISIIAHHAARLVPDSFRPSELSHFPHSLYMIGLQAGWIFEAPFATIPISMASFSATGWDSNEETELGPENVEFLVRLLEGKNNEASPSN